MPSIKNRDDNAKPTERHITAAWVSIDRSKPVSKVTIPPEDAVNEAKGYVDENEK